MVSPLLLILFLTLPFSLFLFFFQKQKNKAFPPGPKGLPIIGNLHQFHFPTLHIQLWKLSKLYGPLFSIKLGLRPCLVVSNSKMAQEVLKTHDIEFCGRPSFLAQNKISYNRIEIAFSAYNDSWKAIKKICITHFLNSSSVSKFSSIRQFEVNQMIKEISIQASSKSVTNLNDAILSLTNTIIYRIAFGRSYKDDKGIIVAKRLLGLLNESQALLGAFFVSDYVPFMGWIDKLRGMHSLLERSCQKFDAFLQEIVNQHLDPKRQKSDDEEEEENVIDVLLKLKNNKEQSFPFDLTYDHIKAVLMDILIGGTYSSAATSTWAMANLMKNPKAMMKVQEEVRNFFGSKGFVDEDEIRNNNNNVLPYLKAVIKETLRLVPPLPLLLTRETNEACKIGEYEIEAKTLVYVNAWAIQRDPEIWKDPEEFYPERFLKSSIDFKGQDFELIPFGSGRRICPGLNMGVATVEIIVANLLFWFDWEIPIGMEDLDNNEVKPGIVHSKKNPLYLRAKNYYHMGVINE
ncbi:cytochrome P450 83B1 [Arachis ipaensis]|uniref:cytochrome P450 83B1 n=1 Tax=Arachis ipaensis TaxID=130454 RepID=UPI0007AF487D|nr:cytochrome P450 83B1 [Arachis ipaensis]XP_025634029.1 cytochrome P450 83B1 [Arachis hypogaea]QHO25097.1 Cytochrome P450 [Arachis hypogaea]